MSTAFYALTIVALVLVCAVVVLGIWVYLLLQLQRTVDHRIPSEMCAEWPVRCPKCGEKCFRQTSLRRVDEAELKQWELLRVRDNDNVVGPAQVSRILCIEREHLTIFRPDWLFEHPDERLPNTVVDCVLDQACDNCSYREIHLVPELLDFGGRDPTYQNDDSVLCGNCGSRHFNWGGDLWHGEGGPPTGGVILWCHECGAPIHFSLVKSSPRVGG